MTENLQNIQLARDVAFTIRAKIKEVTGLKGTVTPASLAPNARACRRLSSAR